MDGNVLEESPLFFFVWLVGVFLSQRFGVMLERHPNVVEHSGFPLEPDEFSGVSVGSFRLSVGLKSTQNEGYEPECCQRDASTDDVSVAVVRFADLVHHNDSVDVGLHVCLHKDLSEQGKLEAASRRKGKSELVDVVSHPVFVLLIGYGSIVVPFCVYR